MIGAKRFELEAQDMKPIKKRLSPLLDALKPRETKQEKNELRKLDSELDKIDKNKFNNKTTTSNNSNADIGDRRLGKQKPKERNAEEKKSVKPQPKKEQEEPHFSLRSALEKREPTARVDTKVKPKVSSYHLVAERKDQAFEQEKNKEEKKPTLTEDDINQISYRVFSSIRRYLNEEKERNREAYRENYRENYRDKEMCGGREVYRDREIDKAQQQKVRIELSL